MFSTTKDIEVKQEFPGSAGKGKKLPDYKNKSVMPKHEFTGSAGKGKSLPKQKIAQGKGGVSPLEK